MNLELALKSLLIAIDAINRNDGNDYSETFVMLVGYRLIRPRFQSCMTR